MEDKREGPSTGGLILGQCALCLALPVSIAATNAVAAVLTCLALCHAGRARTGAWRRLLAPACLCLWLYCGVAVLVSLTGVEPQISLRMLPKDFHKVWILNLLLVVFSMSPNPRAWRPLGISFGFMACVGIFQVMRGWILWSWPRAHGFVHPVTYGEQMALALLGGVCFLARSQDLTPEPSRRLCAAAFVLAAFAALVLSQTRGALLGALAGFAIISLIAKPLRRWWIGIVFLAVLLVAAWVAMPMGGRSFYDMAHIFTLKDAIRAFSGGREVLWTTAVRMFWDHPWVGVGPGSYHILFSKYFSGTIDNQGNWGSAHNLYLHQLAERGVIGLVALALVLGALTVRAWRRAKARPEPWNLWALGTMAAFLVMNLTEVAFQNEQMTTLTLFIWAWAEARYETG